MAVDTNVPYQMRVLEKAVSAHVKEMRATYSGLTKLLPNHHPAVMECREELINALRTFRAVVRTKDRFHRSGQQCGTPGCSVTPEESMEMTDRIIMKIRTEIANLGSLQDDAQQAEPIDHDEAIGMAIGVLAAHTGVDFMKLI